MRPILSQAEQYPWRIAAVKQARPIPESDHWGRLAHMEAVAPSRSADRSLSSNLPPPKTGEVQELLI